MKRILPLVVILVLLLSACQPKAPAPTPNLVQTAVVLTLTAQPTTVPPTRTPLLPTPTLSLPTPTPTQTLASATPSPLPPPPAGATAAPVWYPNYADQFIRYYYQNINARNYNLTWSLLTDAFKYAVNGPAQGGYQGYVDFWNTVARVDISSVVITGQSSGTATVTVAMTYYYFNGRVASVNQPFNLLFDASRNTWMFHSPTTVVPTPIAASPQSFIYYYFDRINARDYGTTWALLHDTFKAHMNPPSSGGYDGYVAYWNSVSRLDILGLTLNSQSGIYADITVSMVFNYTSGTSVASNQLFHLIYDSSRGTWLFYWP
jgi:hypothetical protein